ncbi:response regulator transcription factor [Bacillus sp. FJAT-45350]|uniref:response regulator transcription factor n=1 Tax=Bacillus sp. FJAT-45350 TaxID=2011014 RepID=UPI000BB8B327|nr:response regulator transcription factor [Bacillus sp. FJAT-45350]
MAFEHIVVIDDEEEIGELLSLYLKKEGYTYTVVQEGLKGIEVVKEEKPDLIILDIFLPDVSGLDVCRTIRTFSETPILFLSCKDTEVDKIVGLTIGADDYISKPFSPNELIARMKAHLRRVRLLKKPFNEEMKNEEPSFLISKSLKLDLKKHESLLHNRPLTLSAKEFQLLSFFMAHPKQVFSTEHLLEKIWGYEQYLNTKTVKVHIGNLRKKIEEDPKNPKILLNIRGVGYKFNEDNT